MNPYFSKILIDWYAQNHRNLPWRETRDPYRIWISEIILQQTRVIQGYDYFLRFVHRFPDVESLARASQDDVLLMWQGLGYYSRARNLHKAARSIAEMGTFPSDYEAIRALPGIGDYTAAAIASFAFDQPHAVLDGNVYRILSRFLGIDTPIDTSAGHKLFRALAYEMLDIHQPAIYNQAIMDFGALVCTPHPSCQQCPLVDSCSAFRQGVTENLPVKSHRTKVRQRPLVYVLFRSQGHVLIHRRSAGDIWQGLYEPFLLEPSADGLPPLYDQLLAVFPSARQLVVAKKHQLSHQLLLADLFVVTDLERLQVDNLLAHHYAQTFCQANYQWVPESSLGDYAAPRLVLDLYKKVNFCE